MQHYALQDKTNNRDGMMRKRSPEDSVSANWWKISTIRRIAIMLDVYQSR